MYMINCILLVLLLLVSIVTLKCPNFPLVAYFLNFVPLFHLVTFNYDLSHFLCDLLSPIVPDDFSCKDTFSFCFSN